MNNEQQHGWAQIPGMLCSFGEKQLCTLQYRCAINVTFLTKTKFKQKNGEEQKGIKKNAMFYLSEE